MFKRVFKGKKRRIIFGVIVLAVVIVGIIMAVSKPQQSKEDQKEATVHPVQVQPISESGLVKARHHQDINVPEGAKVNLYVNDGANVSAGDVLGVATNQQDLTDGTNKVNQLQTQIANAQQQGGDTSDLRAELTDAQRKLNQANKSIVAPYDGTVSIDDTDTSNVKVAIASTDKYIASSVTDFDYDSLATGDAAQVATNAGDVTSTEKITFIAQIAKTSGKVTSYDFKTTASPKYRVGQQVTLKIKQDKVALPASAVKKEDGQAYVYLVQGGRAHKQALPMQKSGASYIVDEAGLSPNATVVKAPGQRDLDGKQI
ncbi:efflux RND transporter periplasmic adaptor subunit [Weissella viridescens]|uniref:Efflux RND transporter periplasmic adaptor subunit n=1 Tax=Weissella viridescens TaxID=1629 RepID=A0A3P2R9I8_WEIVI|nr:efflux RND transporter periplasmic adaptor subunit [Weissella viridescens]RRG17469.1 efflux RND transporter periplasmic adaptor subunit [Weissella viridescens]